MSRRAVIGRARESVVCQE